MILPPRDNENERECDEFNRYLEYGEDISWSKTLMAAADEPEMPRPPLDELIGIELLKQTIACWEYAVRTDFSSFFLMCCKALYGDFAIREHAHLAIIADELDGLEYSKSPRLIINLSPRLMKTTEVSVAYSAWMLAHDPSLNIYGVSESTDLAERINDDVRTVLKSPWFRQIFPDCKILVGYNRKSNFRTKGGGGRCATALTKPRIGIGADILMFDDPHNPKDIHNKNKRKKVQDLFSNTYLPRLNSRSKSKVIVVHQRLHCDDLSGYLINGPTGHLYNQLSLPVIFDEDTIIDKTKYGGGYYEFKAGEPLCEAQYSLKDIEIVKLEMGKNEFEAQYMQRPVPESSGIIKKKWLNYITMEDFLRMRKDYADERYNLGMECGFYISVDSAIKDGNHNCYTAITVICVAKNNYYVVDAVRKRLLLDKIEDKLLELSRKWHPIAILVEDNGAGAQLIQGIKSNLAIPIKGINPIDDKFTRLMLVSHMIEAGQLYLIKDQPWLEEFEEELLSFPDSPYNDQVDSLTQFLNHVKDIHRRFGYLDTITIDKET